jgi:hypothetical protein
VERKVSWASVGAYLGSAAALGLLEAVTDQPALVSPLPDPLEPFVFAIIPGLLALFAGWRAKHTPRPDLPVGTEPGQR